MLEINGLTADLGEFTLNSIDLNVEEGEYFLVLGPTGAGKTILLEVIAGIYSADAGRIVLDGRDITNTPPRDRSISMVYQDYMLFPHLTVEENIRFGLKAEPITETEADRRVSNFADLLDISDILHRYPRTLSGGEKQRATLARSLVLDPELLLLDEPVSALDVPSEEMIIEELEQIHNETGVTIMHVTHGREEALRLGDRMGVMRDGEIVQTGPTTQVFNEPNSTFVANFLGTENMLDGTARIRNGCARVQLDDDVEIEADSGVEGNVTACIRPEQCIVSKTQNGSDGKNAICGKVVGLSERESTIQLRIDAGVELTASMTKVGYAETDIDLGAEVHLSFDPSAVHLIEREGPS